MDTEDVPVSAKKVGKVKGKTKFKSKPALDEGTKVSSKAAAWLNHPAPPIPPSEARRNGVTRFVGVL